MGYTNEPVFCTSVLDGTGYDNRSVWYDFYGGDNDNTASNDGKADFNDPGACPNAHNTARVGGIADSIDHVSGSYNRSTSSYNHSTGRNDHDVGRNNSCHNPDYRNPDTDDHSHQSSSSDHTGRTICRGNQMGE